MNELQGQLSEAFAFRKSKEYNRALEIYESLWEQNSDQFNDWAGWSYAWCLKETQQYEKALDICRKLYLKYNGFTMLMQLYANCIYYTQFNTKEIPPLHILKKAIEAMCKLYPAHLPYSLTARAIFKYIKISLSETNIDWDDAENWLLKLDPDLLETTSFKMMGPKGKMIEFASPLEEWYSLMIKIKAGKNESQSLLDLLETTKKLNLKWHYNNQIWFARKEAFAYIQLGQKTKGENILRKIISQKNDWFLFNDLADIVSDKQEAIKLYCKAALAFGEIEKKVKLYSKLYQLFKMECLDKEAKLHLILIAAIRNKEGWAIPIDLERDMNAYQINDLSSYKIKELLKELDLIWKSKSDYDKQKYEGVIEKILEGNSSGFIKTKEGNKYYFSNKEALALKNKFHVGTKVIFELANGFDKKKQVATKNAIRLQII